MTPCFSRPSLCLSCKRAIVTEGDDATLVVCDATMPARSITMAVRACTRHENRTQLDWLKLYQLAWLVDVADDTPAGFVHPSERTPDQDREAARVLMGGD